MNRTAVYGALLVAFGLAAGVSLGWRGEQGRRVDERRGGSVSASGQSPDARRVTRLERQLAQLAAKLEVEAAGRRRLEGRIAALATELTALHGSGHEAGHTPKSESVAAVPGSAGVPANAAASAAEGATSMEHALVAAGIDPTTATDIRRRRDELTLSEIYLRDQATREGWIHTPEFAAKMAEIDAQRTSIRDEIGDDAYDRYLAALDHPNRVAVNEVMLDSPAAAAGIQPGDVVLSYGDTRIFAPNELVTATRGGTAGETVQVQIMRQGQLMTIDVPRGPLGVSIAASKGTPGGG